MTGIVTGGTEGFSRVQWFKTVSSTLDGEKDLEALSTLKIAKVNGTFSEYRNLTIKKVKIVYGFVEFQCNSSTNYQPQYRHSAYL